MTEQRGHIARLLVAVILALPTLALAPTPSLADPVSKGDLESARARYADLNRQLSLVVEQYDQAKLKLEETNQKLQQMQSLQAQAQADAERAIQALTARASSAYMDAGSQLDVLLDAGSFSDFSDRLEFVSRLASQDSDLAARADAANQRAQWAAEQLAEARKQQEQALAQLDSRRGQVQSAIAQQKALVSKYQDALAQQRKDARAAAAAAAAQQQAASTGGSGGDGGSWNPPPINGSGAAAAVSAAESVIGTRYVWGGASPSGFDCSGLTMWSWAHGGVSLPHSSAAQYAATPRVDRGDLQPGDLVFFYSPISHVGLYVGGGAMIDASHPGPGGEVARRAIFWGSYAGAGRP